MTIEELKQRAEAKEINLRYYLDGTVGISLDETVREKDINDLLAVFKVDTTAEQVWNKIFSNYEWNIKRCVFFLIDCSKKRSVKQQSRAVSMET